ncbi:hypothetical protein RJT34_29887 [Clitoria ternatea]|uniref:RNase H type-1 domain-containing protein n=1 Tax=Clitoria ternatea TaxID=43366 RepID=A0AAN9EW18_CLITE
MSLNERRLMFWAHANNADLILNVDRSSIGNPGPMGFGGVSRNEDENWIVSCYGHIDVATNMQVELVVVLQGLHMAQNHGAVNVEARSDSNGVVDLLLQNQVELYLKYAFLIKNISEVVGQLRRVKLVHTFREGNICANTLVTKRDENHDRLVVLNNPSLEVLDALRWRSTIISHVPVGNRSLEVIPRTNSTSFLRWGLVFVLCLLHHTHFLFSLLFHTALSLSSLFSCMY